MEKKTPSPREQALIYASNARQRILENKHDVVSTLRACLVVASMLNKEDVKKWISNELNGYSKSQNVPDYRIFTCERFDKLGFSKGFETYDVRFGVHTLNNNLKMKKTMFVAKGSDSISVHAGILSQLLSTIVDECLFFLNEIIDELQYGGKVEYLMEEIRKNTDEKLAKLDNKLADEARSLFLNLTSTNPADWNKVGHSSRKMLKILSDNVFPAKAEKHKMKDGREIKVGDQNFINRLIAFLDKKVTGEERRFLISEIKYFESYLRQVTKYAQMEEHAPSIEKYHADMLAIHTYLIISEILKHKN